MGLEEIIQEVAEGTAITLENLFRLLFGGGGE
jgi:hypothetical protein